MSRRTTRSRAPANAPAPANWAVALAPLAACWLTVGAVEILIAQWVPGSALHDIRLTVGARLTLAADGLMLLLAAMLSAGLVSGVARQLVRALPVRFAAHRLVRWTILSLAGLTAWSAFLLYGASWALFWNAGVFLDDQAFRFLAPHPIQVFHWVYPPLAIGVLVVTMIATVVVGIWIPKWTASRKPRMQSRLTIAAAAAVVLCLIASSAGAVVYRSQSAEMNPQAATSFYALSRRDRATPLLHALAAFERHLAPSSPTLSATSTPAAPTAATATVNVTAISIRIVRRPIVTMEQYLATVQPERIKRRNVVMVQIESLRSDQLRVYGGTRDVMPAVDNLARQSRVFTNAYIQASHSNYADLVPLSSGYPLRSAEMYEYPVNPTYPRVLIYDVLKALGYKTAIFSSQNERWGAMINFQRLSSLDRFFHAETFGGPTYAPFGDAGFSEWVKQTGSAGSVDDRYTVDEAIRWIDSIPGMPFFLHMNLQSSHVPYVVPDDFPRRFGPRTLDFTIMWGRFPEDKVNVVKDRYADSLFYEDTQVSRLFVRLRQLGLWDNTIVIVGGDNGEAFYEHGLAAHASTLYNEVVKVPMIIKAPALVASLDGRPAMFLDIPPSILHLLGLPPHPGFQGISLFDERPNPNRSIYTIVQTPLAFQSAVVRGGFKLLYSEWERRYYLWDQVRDAAERFNIADARPDLVQELAARLQTWRSEQLGYYADVARQSREYPPVFED